MSGPRETSDRPGRTASWFGRREREAQRRRQDQTDRALSDAREQAAILSAMLDEIDEAVVLLDERDEPRTTNRAAGEILGSGAASPAVASIRLGELAAAVRASGEPVEAERELHVPARRLLAIRVVPFGAGTLALITDITRARRSDQVRRDFVANVSHELKTPISGIALLAEQLADAIREDPDAAARFAERIHTETERLARLVVDLLDLSRIESELPFSVADVPAAAIVEDAVGRVSAVAEAKGIAIDVAFAGGVSAVRADATAAATALANLLDNAVRYSGERAAVRVRVTAAGGEVSFEVEDEGTGIPTEELGRIFERFYRVDKARARATGGTGLGLAIVKHVAERHGGRVEAASEFGRGSRFTLILPAGGSA